ncbi:MAG: hypothetical protein ACXVIL_10940, partial [Halobacteriota archaeon]
GDALKGALDDYCQNDSGAPFALYCSGDTEVKQGDRISFNDRNDQLVKLEVTAVKNPMMHYRYLVVWCKSDRRSH